MWNIFITSGARVLNKDPCFNWLEILINPCYSTSHVIFTSPSHPHLYLPLSVLEWKILWVEDIAYILASSSPFPLGSWSVYWHRMFSLVCSHVSLAGKPCPCGSGPGGRESCSGSDTSHPAFGMQHEKMFILDTGHVIQ